MSFADSARRYASAAAKNRAECFPVKVTAPGVAKPVSGAKLPTQVTRERLENAGYVQYARATFTFPITSAYVPTIGDKLTILSCDAPADVGTEWSCQDITFGNSTTGTDHVCRCVRLDR